MATPEQLLALIEKINSGEFARFMKYGFLNTTMPGDKMTLKELDEIELKARGLDYKFVPLMGKATEYSGYIESLIDLRDKLFVAKQDIISLCTELRYSLEKIAELQRDVAAVK